MAEDKNALLNQLVVEREPAARSRGGRNAVVAAIVVSVVGGGIWLARAARTNDAVVRVAEVRALAADGAAPGASVLEASGYVVAQKTATVSAKTTGRVLELLVDEGQRVTRGQILARLDDSNARGLAAQAEAQLAQAQANSLAAKVAYEDAKPTYERSVRLHKEGVASDDMFDAARMAYNAVSNSRAVSERAEEVARANLRVARQTLDDAIVRAPFSGVVTVKAAQAGDMVSPVSAGGGFTRTGICTIVDMSSLALDVEINEKFISRIRAGQPVEVTLNAYPDSKIPAVVAAVIPTADRAKATVRVRIAFRSEDPRILPEMAAHVVVLEEKKASAPAPATASPAVVVPSEAVQGDGEKGVVFVVHDDAVERRAVRLGEKSSSGQIVLSGLSAGMKVAVGDLNSLADGARVRFAEQ